MFEQDLEDKLAAAGQGSEACTSVKQQVSAVQARGAQVAFLGLPEELQRSYTEVSLSELSAYACWLKGPGSRRGSEAEAEWDRLDCDDKAEWVPGEPRETLTADWRWAPLLPMLRSPPPGRAPVVRRADGLSRQTDAQ